MQSAETAQKTSLTHDTRVVIRRLAALFRLRMLKALAEASDAMRRQAALAQNAGRADGLVQLLPTSLSRQIRAELKGEQIVAMFLLYETDLDRRIEMLRGRSDLPESGLPRTL